MNENNFIDKEMYYDFLAYIHMEVTLKAINSLIEKQCDEFMNFFNNEFDEVINECCLDFSNRSFV